MDEEGHLFISGRTKDVIIASGQNVRAGEAEAAILDFPGVAACTVIGLPAHRGAAAAIVCNEAFAKKHGLDTSVRIRAQAMTTDGPATFAAGDMREVVGYSMSKEAARQVYEQAGIGPEDLDVVELHDCFAQNELITYEALGLCASGGAEQLILDGDNTYGGKVVTNSIAAMAVLKRWFKVMNWPSARLSPGRAAVLPARW